MIDPRRVAVLALHWQVNVIEPEGFWRAGAIWCRCWARTRTGVRNVRAAGGRAVLRHGRREAVLLEEVEPAQRAPVLRRYLAVAPGARQAVWSAVRAGLAAHLRERGLDGLAAELAAEAPQPQPHSGKLRHVLAAPPARGPGAAAAGAARSPNGTPVGCPRDW